MKIMVRFRDATVAGMGDGETVASSKSPKEPLGSVWKVGLFINFAHCFHIRSAWSMFTIVYWSRA